MDAEEDDAARATGAQTTTSGKTSLPTANRCLRNGGRNDDYGPLTQPEPVAPVGVSASDWEGVLQARREATEIERLRRLGPQLQLGEMVASTDEVGVRRPEKRRWLEIRTACVRPTTGYRYLSGTAQAVLQQLYGLLLLCGGMSAKLTLLGDGARWIATFLENPARHLAEQ